MVDNGFVLSANLLYCRHSKKKHCRAACLPLSLPVLQTVCGCLQISFAPLFSARDLWAVINTNRMKTQTKLVLIRIAGVVSVFLTLFHAGFYWLLNWAQTLAVMNPDDRAILLTFNLIGVMLLLWSVVASLAFPRKLLDNVAGKSILLFFTAFYMVRIYGEFAYFGFHMPQSLFIIALCLVPMIGFGLPLLTKSK